MNHFQCCISFQRLLIRRCQGSRQLLRVEARGGPKAKRWRCSASPSRPNLTKILVIQAATHSIWSLRSESITLGREPVLKVLFDSCRLYWPKASVFSAATGPVELRLSFAFTIPQTASIMFSSLQLSHCTTVSSLLEESKFHTQRCPQEQKTTSRDAGVLRFWCWAECSRVEICTKKLKKVELGRFLNFGLRYRFPFLWKQNIGQAAFTLNLNKRNICRACTHG